MASCKSQIDYKSGTRHAKHCVIETIDAEGGAWRAELTPHYNFYMSGIGYTHPEWGHGHYKGENALGYDTIRYRERRREGAALLACAGILECEAFRPDGLERKGAGVLEQLVIGAHAPSGFKGLMDRSAVSDDIAARLQAYLAKKLEQPHLRVSDVARIPGGASRETYRFRARSAATSNARLILRRDPPASLIETERDDGVPRLSGVSQALGLPVPEPDGARTRRCCAGPAILRHGRDHRLRSRLHPQSRSLRRTSRKDRRAILERAGTASRQPTRAPSVLAISKARAIPNDAWAHEVARWEKVIDEDEREPQPIARAAHPLAETQSAAARTKDFRRAWRLSHGKFPVRRRTAISAPSSTGKWRIWAIRWKISAGRSILCGRMAIRRDPAGIDCARRCDRDVGSGERSESRSGGACLVGNLSQA